MKEKLFEAICDSLLIDRSFIHEDSNLNLLCILSNYLEGIDKSNLVFNPSSLKVNYLDHIKVKGRAISLDLGFLFEGGSSHIYQDEIGSDGFYSHQLQIVFLIMSLETKLGFEVDDDRAEKFETVKDILSFLKL